jgi:NADPH-dependent curcumin reductase CurA
MTELTNTCVCLARRPDGMPTEDCWKLEERSVEALQEGQVVVAIETVSIDPAMRAWMDESCYVGCVQIGETMWAFAVGTVRESLHENFSPGDKVRGLLGVQHYGIVHGDELELLDCQDEQLSNHLSVYGMTGLTAYFGITDVVQVKPGDQVLVSTAAGAVGSVVAQIARMNGARVVGIAGGPEKIAFCTDELGLDACVDYKNGDLEQQLRQKMPEGIDIYFDNVGVPTLDIALKQMNDFGHVVVCGAINQFQNMDDVQGPADYLRIPERGLSLKGFTYFHYVERFPEGVAALRSLVADGKLKFYEDHVQGLENFPAHFIKMFTGQHRGKLCINP